MKKLLTAFTLCFALLSGILFLKPSMRRGGSWWYPRVFAGALSAYNALFSSLSAITAVFNAMPFTALLAALSAWASARYVQKVTAPRLGFEMAFGPGWEERVPPARRALWMPRRWSWKLSRPVGAPAHLRDVPYGEVDGGRRLLTDVWLPPAEVSPSGLAFIYAHGSGWVYMDKDYGTRTFFAYLASQGHVVMDVAYRLYPEAEIGDMLGDVKRAVAWMKEHAQEFGVRPDRVALGGGSAGAHLALMAAFTDSDVSYTPPDLAGRDLTVCGVVSYYAPVDLEAVYYHTGQDVTTAGMARRLPEEWRPPQLSRVAQVRRRIRDIYVRDSTRLGFDKPAALGAFYQLFGGHPGQTEVYERYSPIHCAHTGSPPTLLIQGDADIFIPLSPTEALYHRLKQKKVPVVLLTLPQTDHAFDLFLPQVNPAAQSALYDVERFLALISV